MKFIPVFSSPKATTDIQPTSLYNVRALLMLSCRTGCSRSNVTASPSMLSEGHTAMTGVRRKLDSVHPRGLGAENQTPDPTHLTRKPRDLLVLCFHIKIDDLGGFPTIFGNTHL